MKKKLALLLAATMVVGMMPFSAFAGSDNRVNTTVTATRDEFSQRASVVIENDDKDWTWSDYGTTSSGIMKFQLDLGGAEWWSPTNVGATSSDTERGDDGKDYYSNEASIEAYLRANLRYDMYDVGNDKTLSSVPIGAQTHGIKGIKVQKLTGSKITVELTRDTTANWVRSTINKLTVPLPVKFTDDGEATITVDRLESSLSNGTYTFGTVTNASTTTTIESVRAVPESGKMLKIITINENVKNSIDVSKNNGLVELKLSSNFRFSQDDTNLKVTDAVGKISMIPSSVVVTDDKVTFRLQRNAGSTDLRSKLIIDGLYVIPEDDTSPNDTATLTISGCDIDKTRLEVAKYVDYGYEWEAEDKDLPIIYSGTHDETDNDSLKVYFNETTRGSWLRERKTEITFPDEVKVNSVDIKKKKNASEITNGGVIQIDGSKVTILGSKVQPADSAEIEFIFNLSVEAGFTGDIEATLGGNGVTEELSTVVARAEMPFTVETAKNEVKIDYRNVPVNDLTIKEAYAGALEKDRTLRLRVEQMQFEKDVTAEVTEGDLTVKKVETTGGAIDIKIDKESVKTAGTIKVSNLQLFLNRSLPAGDYRLSAVPVGTSTSDAFFKNYDSDVTSDEDKGEKLKWFERDEVVLLPDFVSVVTAPRDQDDSTFTTKLTVVIGSSEMQVGDRTIPLTTPAYISAEGYTMLPVRAITEALSGSAIVNWDNASRKVTIIFGSRIISMTIDSNIMTINGTDVPMSSRAVITDDYTFLPLRDLGYALGLSDDKINWDSATRTVTLN